MRRLLRTGILYVVVFLPTHAFSMFVEAWLRGDSPFADVSYSFSSWEVYFGIPLVITGLTGVPAYHVLLDAIRRWFPAAVATLAGAALAVLVLAANSIAISYILMLPGPSRQIEGAFMILSFAPVSFAGGALAFGWSVARFVPAPSNAVGNATSGNWVSRLAITYGIPVILIGTYGYLLPAVAPRLAYRISGSGVRMRMEMDVLEDVSVGTPVGYLEDRLPGFLPKSVLDGGSMSLSAGNFRDYGYEIRVDSGRVQQLEFLQPSE